MGTRGPSISCISILFHLADDQSPLAWGSPDTEHGVLFQRGTVSAICNLTKTGNPKTLSPRGKTKKLASAVSNNPSTETLPQPRKTLASLSLFLMHLTTSLCVCILMAVWIKRRVLQMLGKHTTMELWPGLPSLLKDISHLNMIS